MSKTGTFGSDGLSEGDAVATLAKAGVAVVVTNPSLPDNPIVYINDAFERVTGYDRSAVIGRNCRFLQGPQTDPDHRRILREGIAAGEEVSLDILNYRADGTPFRNRLLVSPVHDDSGRISFFLGIQKVLSDEDARRSLAAAEALREIQHRVKNHLAMIVGLIRMQQRGETATDDYDTLARRVESLQLLYEELSHAGAHRHGDRISLGAYLSRVGHAVAHLDGRPGIRVAIDMAPLQSDVESAARLGLILSEMVTNALEHAFDGREDGRLSIRLATGGDGRAELRVEDDGAGFPDGTVWPDMGSLGGRIVAGLVDGLSGSLSVESDGRGTRIALLVPREALGR